MPPPDLVQDSLASGGGVLCVGLPRTGTQSMAAALNKLGYRHVHHSLTYSSEEEWVNLMAAAHAHFPWLSRGKLNKPVLWANSDWNAWLGHFQAVTDGAALFAPQLIRAYPNAKVILVVRPFERWMFSMESTVMTSIYSWDGMFRRYIRDPLARSRSAQGLRDLIGGWLEADTLAEAKANARRRYNEHHYVIRKMVPSDRLLVYELGDGWEPLAKFLGKDVPAAPFPHKNGTSSVDSAVRKPHNKKMRMAAINLLWLLLPFFGMLLGYWIAKSELSLEAMVDWATDTATGEPARRI